jgi:hypothetical protein
MLVPYYFKEDDRHWQAFFERHIQYELIRSGTNGIIHLINSYLGLYNANLIIETKNSGEPFVTGIEFRQEEDRTHFLLIY